MLTTNSNLCSQGSTSNIFFSTQGLDAGLEISKMKDRQLMELNTSNSSNRVENLSHKKMQVTSGTSLVCKNHVEV